MTPGAFSLSLAVADIDASLAFYQRLGFEILDDHRSEHWMILRAGEATLGLFEGFLPSNTLTFHPADAAALRAQIEASGHAVEAAPDATSFMLTDPDGNPVLVDQLDPNYQPSA